MDMDMIDYQAGDAVVHVVYGLGQILGLDQKTIAGQTTLCYMVQVNHQASNMTVWVPVENAAKSSLRQPTPAQEFSHLFTILSGPGEPLSQNRQERKVDLIERLRAGSLESICGVIRDLALFGRTKKLSDQDLTIMERAQEYLLKEWRLVLEVPRAQAEQDLKRLISG